MHCIDLIAAAVPDEYVPTLPEMPAEGVCALTGAAGPTIAAKHLLGASFTQWDQLAVPDSDRVSINAWRAWMYGWREDGKKRDFRPERMSSWVVQPDGLTQLSRQGVRAFVLGGVPHGPWAGYATTSYKKHGSLLAPVNSADYGIWLWETRRVDCSDAYLVHEWWDSLRAYQDAGIPRPVLESADPEPHLIRKVGVSLTMAFMQWARSRRESALYQFLCYLLPSAEELKAQRLEPCQEVLL